MIKRMRMNQAIGLALAEELAADERVVLIGEDIGAAGGVFKTSEGLLDQFGPLRVRDTPIAEMGFVGAAVGAAMAGLRPVAEIMFAEFLGVALDQLVTQGGLTRFLSAGEYTAPLVVRVSAGAGLGFGAQHSQTLENWYLNVPGLTVVAASGAASAYRLVRAAIRDPDPVLLIEPRILYGERETVDTDAPRGSLTAATIVRRGRDATMIGFGQTVPTARRAAELAAEDGLDLEIIDLTCLSPYDSETLLGSVRRTGRLITVEANPAAGGWGAHVVAGLLGPAWNDLRAAPLRITAPDTPVPYSAELERRWLPDPESVAAQAAALVRDDVPPAPWWAALVPEASHG